MTLSVVIPAYNEEKYLRDCLQSCMDHAPDSLLEIIVVDNASTDNTTAVAKSFPGVRVISEPRKGLTHARQCGLLAARGDLIAYIDADTRVPADWFHILAREFAEDPGMVCLSGPYDYYDLPEWQRMTVKLYWNTLARSAYRVTHYMVVGGNFVAKREALQAIGGFDTRIPFYGEDTNIARRLHAAGRVKFLQEFTILTSGRRFREKGFLGNGAVYVANFLSQAVMKKSMTKHYVDVR